MQLMTVSVREEQGSTLARCAELEDSPHRLSFLSPDFKRSASSSSLSDSELSELKSETLKLSSKSSPKRATSKLLPEMLEQDGSALPHTVSNLLDTVPDTKDVRLLCGTLALPPDTQDGPALPHTVSNLLDAVLDTKDVQLLCGKEGSLALPLDTSKPLGVL